MAYVVVVRQGDKLPFAKKEKKEATCLAVAASALGVCAQSSHSVGAENGARMAKDIDDGSGGHCRATRVCGTCARTCVEARAQALHRAVSGRWPTVGWPR